jgi:hypothetical protein
VLLFFGINTNLKWGAALQVGNGETKHNCGSYLQDSFHGGPVVTYFLSGEAKVMDQTEPATIRPDHGDDVAIH